MNAMLLAAMVLASAPQGVPGSDRPCLHLSCVADSAVSLHAAAAAPGGPRKPARLGRARGPILIAAGLALVGFGALMYRVARGVDEPLDRGLSQMMSIGVCIEGAGIVVFGGYLTVADATRSSSEPP